MTGDCKLDLAMEFAQVAISISESPDLGSARRRVVELGVQQVGCARANLWHLPERGKHLRLDACTDPKFAAEMAELACTSSVLADTCWRDRTNVVVDDFSAETRWPEYVGHILERTSVRSAAAFCLGIDGEVSGALVFYADKPHEFTMERLALASIYAAHASIALQDASRGEQAANLARALESNRRIGMAIGVLVALYKISEQQAFDLMRIASQRTHVKLHEIAEEVILTGAAPKWPEPRKSDRTAAAGPSRTG